MEINDLFFTKTFARVLIGQGRLDDALTICTILKEKTPDDSELNSMLEELKTLAKNKRSGIGGRE